MKYNNAKFEKSFGISSQLPISELPEITFSGRSNVGKSSLLNKLFNRNSLARVSSVPGKTITINFYDVDCVKFVDLPGYGYAKLSKQERDRFGELMEGYFHSNRNIKLVVQLVDLRHKPSQDDYSMIDFLYQMDIPVLVVCTKADKLKVKEFNKRCSEIKEELSMIDENRIIAFSSKTGLGIDEIKKTIDASLK